MSKKRAETVDRRSTAIRLLDLVWASCNKAIPHSWERLNHAMHAAVSLACGSGFEFAEGDIGSLWPSYNAGHWMGSSPEWLYTLAVAVGNMAAVKSYEAYARRGPFIADDVVIRCHTPWLHSSAPSRQRERLCVGAAFPWKGHTASVTSFSPDGTALVAVARRDGKLVRRFCVTREDILADRAERKERGDLLRRLTEAGKQEGMAGKILKALGIASREELGRLPIGKVRKVAARFAPEGGKRS